MPVIKQNFSLKYDDIEKLNKALLKFQGNKEKTINNCLEKITSKKMTKSVTNELPYYNKQKVQIHAKDNKWYELEFYNLSFVLSNSLKGKRGTSFYYLYYPATGKGNSYRKTPNEFFERGFAKEQDNAIKDLLEALNNELEEELNNDK